MMMMMMVRTRPNRQNKTKAPNSEHVILALDCVRVVQSDKAICPYLEILNCPTTLARP